MPGLVPEDPQAGFRISALDFEHLRELELGQSRMREIEGDGHAGDAVRREPLVGQPVARAESEAPPLELTLASDVLSV